MVQPKILDTLPKEMLLMIQERLEHESDIINFSNKTSKKLRDILGGRQVFVATAKIGRERYEFRMGLDDYEQELSESSDEQMRIRHRRIAMMDSTYNKSHHRTMLLALIRSFVDDELVREAIDAYKTHFPAVIWSSLEKLLHAAIEAGRMPVVQRLVQLRADINETDFDTCRDALDVAMISDQEEIALYLLKKPVYIAPRHLERSVEKRAPRLLKAMLSKKRGMKPDLRLLENLIGCASGVSFLDGEVSDSDGELANYSDGESKYDDSPSYYGDSPSKFDNNIEVLSLLVEAGARLTKAVDKQQDVVETALFNGCTRNALFLLERQIKRGVTSPTCLWRGIKQSMENGMPNFLHFVKTIYPQHSQLLFNEVSYPRTLADVQFELLALSVQATELPDHEHLTDYLLDNGCILEEYHFFSAIDAGNIHVIDEGIRPRFSINQPRELKRFSHPLLLTSYFQLTVKRLFELEYDIPQGQFRGLCRLVFHGVDISSAAETFRIGISRARLGEPFWFFLYGESNKTLLDLLAEEHESGALPNRAMVTGVGSSGDVLLQFVTVIRLALGDSSDVLDA
ncbi:uncharacterized protein JN550_002626 [Neoarthrinium moseri]|uniref:uncharacterized protein n=1 Tax=Neoarthrinium moseri TaxID=1658444 RepID=UPI001FDB8E66|nr:uncharacterized protein JN550_002626 [Neoarthrinium moseri]KAI1874047.1 hypothetical protein JN550_002626 [Neoarthrinium moseri]